MAVGAIFAQESALGDGPQMAPPGEKKDQFWHPPCVSVILLDPNLFFGEFCDVEVAFAALQSGRLHLPCHRDFKRSSTSGMWTLTRTWLHRALGI
jgi:hypothetical protein